MKKAIFSIVIISALLMGLFTYAAIKRGSTTGQVIGDLDEVNTLNNYSDIGKNVPSEENIIINNVDIVNFAFSPIEIEINTGDTVLWENRDIARHTVTSNDGIFDSELIGKGEMFSYKFESAGVYGYYCTPHPYMIGRVVVNDR